MKPYVYGQSPTPSNWKEASEILKASMKPKKKPTSGPSFGDRLKSIESLLKERK